LSEDPKKPRTNEGSIFVPTRRDLLRGLGALVGAELLESGCGPAVPAPRPASMQLAGSGVVPIFRRVSYSETFLRPQDMAWLRVQFHGFERVGGRLIRRNQTAFLVVSFPPQLVSEECYEASGTPPAPGSLHARIGNPLATQLVFRFPDRTNITDEDSIAYTTESIFGWRTTKPAYPVRFLNSPVTGTGYVPRAPLRSDEEGGFETCIEAPLHVFLAPLSGAWDHDAKAVVGPPIGAYHGRTELWQTRLVPNVTDPDLDTHKPYELRRSTVLAHAVWTDNYNSKPDTPEKYLTTMSPAGTGEAVTDGALRVRRELVMESCNAGDHTSDFQARPVEIQSLALSALGASLRVHGEWEGKGAAVKLNGWKHSASYGREQSSEVSDRCLLFPFGHKASMVSQTSREFVPSASGYVGAYLQRRQFILVQQHIVNTTNERTYPYGLSHPQARILIDKSPPLFSFAGFAVPPEAAVRGVSVPMLTATTPFAFPIRLTDHDGNEHDVLLPLVVVEAGPDGIGRLSSDRQGFLKDLNRLYEGFLRNYHANVLHDESLGRKYCDLSGRRVAFARSSDVKKLADIDGLPPGDIPAPTPDSYLETIGILFGADLGTPTPGEDALAWVPATLKAAVRHPALSQLTGAADIEINYHPDYVKGGFGDPKGDIGRFATFAQLVKPLAIDFSQSSVPTSMQVVTPNITAQALSALRGPLPFLPGSGPPGELKLGDLLRDARLFGGVALKDLLGSIPLEEWKAYSPDVPGLTMTTDGTKVTTRYHWETQRINVPGSGIFEPDQRGPHDPPGTPTCRIVVDARLVADTAASSYKIKCAIENFSIHLFSKAAPFASIHFKDFSITKESDASVAVSVHPDRVNFGGALRFVEDIAKSFANVTGPGGLRLPRISVSKDSIAIDHSIGLPSIVTPTFTFAHLAILFGVQLPLDGSPVRLHLGFCSREHPFLLAFGILGGGGFLSFIIRPAIGPKPVTVELVEGSLEFGGTLALDIGVANGEVHVFAGIYFSVASVGSLEVNIQGYLRCGGSLSVLGLVHISVEFYLTLGWDKHGDQQSLQGQASLTVSIDILFFSTSVTLEVRRCIALTSGACAGLPEKEPSLLVASARRKTDWSAYWSAFA
jgi:hypothetical protein